MGSAKGKLTRKELKRLMDIYRPVDRGRWLARMDELQHLVAEMTGDQFDDFLALARRYPPSRPEANMPDLQPQMIIPDAAPAGLDCVLSNLPNVVASITVELMKRRGGAAAREFLERVLASVAGSALMALGKEHAIDMLHLQIEAAEQMDTPN